MNEMKILFMNDDYIEEKQKSTVAPSVPQERIRPTSMWFSYLLAHAASATVR